MGLAQEITWVFATTAAISDTVLQEFVPAQHTGHKSHHQQQLGQLGILLPDWMPHTQVFAASLVIMATALLGHVQSPRLDSLLDGG